MAGGGYARGSGVPLGERTRGARTPAPARAAVQAPALLSADCPARHCWVSLPVDGSVPRPGLLLEWRRTERGRWEGRVAYLATLRPERWSLVEEWVPAELLTGVEA